jgi:hypothetical protein
MRTSTYTIDAIGNPEPVTCTIPGSVCAIITVFENAQAGTADYDVYAPLINSAPIRKPAGSKHEFRAQGTYRFSEGEIVGYLAAASGSMTFAQVEE